MKFWKRILTVCLAVMMLTSLCGCKILDEMRDEQAFLQEDGSIIWKGTTYLQLTSAMTEYLYPKLSEETLYVTTPDVPVLASPLELEFHGQPSKDGMLLQVYTNAGELTYYCRKGDYDTLMKRLSGEFPADVVCFFYTALEFGEYVERHYTLTPEQNSALKDTFENTEPKAASKVGTIQDGTSIYLYQCSADLLLRRSNALVTKTADQYVLQIPVENDVLLYLIPQTHHKAMESLFKAYEDAMWDSLGTEI